MFKDLRRVLGLLRPYRRRFAALVASVAAAQIIETAVFAILIASLMHALGLGSMPAAQTGLSKGMVVTLVAGAAPSARFTNALLLCTALLIGYFLKCACLYAATYLGHYVSQRVVVDLRQRVFDRLVLLPLSFHDVWRTGELMSRITQDVQLVQLLVGGQLIEAVAAPVTIVVGMAVMLKWSWQLTLVCAVFGPPLAILITRAGRRMRVATRLLQAKIADLNARLQERLSSMRVIQSFAREQYEVEHFAAVNQATFGAYMRAARLHALLPPLVEFVGALAVIPMTAFAAYLILLRHSLDAAILIGFVFAGQKVGSQLTRLSRVNLAIQQALAGAGRVFELMDTEPEVRDLPGAQPLDRVQGEVAFRDVSFRYPTGEMVLAGLNLQIKPGEVVALAGPSGAGKTSLVNLIPRFYDPTNGRIELDGHDLRSLTLSSLRSQIGIVPQETVLFGGTIHDNIAYGRIGATREEVIEAANAANAHEFICALPQGYDSEAGEHGVRLSGGQRQRIAIARALLKDPRILILDEATSSLDMESQSLVQEALERLMRGRTTLVIAHRLATIRTADRILVLCDGKITEQGKHEELLTLGGTYARLHDMEYDHPDSARASTSDD